ncbi:MAG: hypothetical protein ACREQI_00400 [Candidatus Binataceae bacterium]
MNTVRICHLFGRVSAICLMAILAAAVQALAGGCFGPSATGRVAAPPAETAASSVELFTNANFSSDDFTGWRVVPSVGSCWSVDQYNPHTSGGYDADFYAGQMGGCPGNYISQGWTNNEGFTLPTESNGLVHFVATAWVATDSSFNGGLAMSCNDSMLFAGPLSAAHVIGGGVSYRQFTVDCYAYPADVGIAFAVDPYLPSPTSGHAYVSDTQFTVFQPPVVSTWLTYPNYRGKQWSNESQTIQLHAYVTPSCNATSCNGILPDHLVTDLCSGTGCSNVLASTETPVSGNSDVDISINYSVTCNAWIETFAYDSNSNLLGSDEGPPAGDPASSDVVPAWPLVQAGNFPGGRQCVIGPDNNLYCQDSVCSYAGGSNSLTCSYTADYYPGDPIVIPSQSYTGVIQSVGSGTLTLFAPTPAATFSSAAAWGAHVNVGSHNLWTGTFSGGDGGYGNEMTYTQNCLKDDGSGMAQSGVCGWHGEAFLTNLADGVTGYQAGGTLFQFDPFGSTSGVPGSYREAFAEALYGSGWSLGPWLWDSIVNQVSCNIQAGSFQPRCASYTSGAQEITDGSTSDDERRRALWEPASGHCNICAH